jgi:hypothetical protein
MVATRRTEFDFSLERIYGTDYKNLLAAEVGVRRLSKL